MQRRMPPSFAWSLLAAMLCILPGHEQSGRADAPDPSAPIRFRRVYIPDDAGDELRKLQSGKRPVAIEEFERLVELLRPAGAEHAENRAHIARAEYRARLDGSQLVDGEALLEVRRLGDGEAPLSLGECRLALGEPQWLTEPPQAAVLATTDQGRNEVLAARNAKLSVPWSLRGESEPSGAVTFRVDLPPSASSRLVLELPAGLVPFVDAGFVEAGRALTADAGRAAAREWGIELGAATSTSLQIVREGSPNRRLLLLRRQKSTYEIKREGGKLSVELRLTVYNEPLHELELELSPELQVDSVRLGVVDQPVSSSPAAGASGGSRLVVHFPQPLSAGTERTLTLTAGFSTLIGQPWRLPRVKVHGASWQEGLATLRVEDKLLVNRLETAGGRQSGQGTLPAPDRGESFDLQFFTPDAEVEILLEPPSPRVELDVGTVLEVDSVAVDAQVVAEVRAVQGRRFELDFLFPAGWTIETVRTEPAEALNDYDVVPRGPEPQQIHVRLNSAIAPDAPAPLRIELRAHRRLPAQGGDLAIDQIRVGPISGGVIRRRLLSVPTPFRLENDVRIERLDPLTLSAADQRLIAAGANRVVLVDDARADRLRLKLVSERPRYAADIEVTAHLETAALVESYRVLVQPESAVSRLLVRFSQPRDEAPLWTLNGESESALAAQRVKPEELERLGVVGGETWEIQLRRARSLPFELRAVRRSDGGRRRVALLSLPDARSQTGTLTLESTGGAGLAIDAPALRAVPAEGLAAERYTDTRAMFRYEPSLEADVDVAPADPQDSQPATWAWTCELVTRYGRSGATCRVTYRLQTTGQRQVEVRLPPRAQLQQLLVDGREVRTSAAGESPHVDVLLPADVRYPTLEVVYRDPGAVLPWGAGEVRPATPNLAGVPVLCQSWTVWLPPDYRVSPVRPPTHALNADSLGERLFGPLWRGAGHPFQLFSEQDWAALAESSGEQRALQSGEDCLAALGRIHLELAETTAQDPSWSQLLSAYQALASANESGAAPPLYVDSAALAAAAVSPQTLAPKLNDAAAAEPPGDVGAELLQAANLILLAGPERIVLTTRRGSLPAATRLTPTNRGVWVMEPASMQATQGNPTEQPTSLELWLSGSAASGAPWHVGSNQSFAGLEDAGWNVYRFDLDPQQAPECTVMQPALFGMLGWSLLLMSAALVFALAARRPAWLVLLVGAAACAACLAAEPYTPLATGALLGALLACGFVAALAPRRRSHAVVAEAARHSGDTTRSMRVAGALLLAVWGGTIAGSSLAAEPPAPHGLTPAPVLYPVIIPVDQDRRPSLGYVWIPPEFDDALREREKLVAGPPHPVRLLRSEYECRLEWQGETLKAESLAAVIEFSVGGEITKPTQISIPLAREGLDLTDAQLAGQRANIEFDKPQDRLLITVDRAGDYLLELRFRPQNHLAGRHTSISARVPRVARSRLRIQVPPGASGVETPSALGSSVFDESSGELVADLGPADRLHVTWPTSGGLEPKRSDLAVEELLWLKVQRPGSVVVDARFRFRREGLIDHVRLTADRRLRPLPAGAESPISEIHDEQHSPDAELKTFHIAVDPPVENEAVLQFSFLLTDASGVGSLRLPHLQAVADRTTSRRMAVNVHPPLEFEQTGQLAALPVDAFVREWGASATESPDLAFDLPKDATPAWSLSTRPKSPRTVVEQATTLVELGRGEAFVDFTADLLTQDGSVFQHRLILPAELNVESVSVKGQEDTAARWSRSADGTLTVLLNRRVTGPQQFSLQARSALENGRFALPQIEFVDAPSASNEYYVQRSPDVQVECNPSDELELVAEVAAELAGRYARSGLRFVAGFRRTSSDPLLACVFEVSPNQPQTSCRSILALRRAGGRWNVENTLRLNVKDGQLDELWLDVSERLAEPLQLEPPADYEVQTVPGQKTRRRVVIRPEQPIRGNATIVLRAALSTQGGEPVNGAEVVPLEMNELELFIVVPRQAEAQSFVWQPRGVQGASLPEGEPMPEVGDEAAVWRAGTPPFSLTLKQSEPLASVPAQVHLADIHFAWGEAGDCRGLAVFDLEPAGLTSCVLVLPPECRLVHASVAGLPATIASQGDHHWRLLLGPAQLPQRIAVVSEGRLPPSGSARSIPAPSLEGISVERTLWTLYPPAGRAVRTDDADTLENHLLRRYESITRLLDRGANVAVEQSSQDVERWYLPWSRRLVALHRVIARSSGNGDSALSELQSMDEVEQRLKVRPAGTAAVEEREIWNLTMPDTESPVRCTLTGSGGGMLDVQESVPANSDWGVRVVACILIGAASLLVFLLALRGPLGDWLHRWPHAVGVLVGLAWWLWLTPSLLGWGIVLLSVISAIRSPWKVQRRTPALVPLSNVSRRASSSS